MYVPKSWNDQRQEDGETMWCINGHQAVYKETTLDKLRQERDRAVQQRARLEDERCEAEKRADAAEAREQRLKKRIAAGTCPCCKRTVKQLAQHMASKHPEFTNIVELKTA
jgi:hypothetical protein